MKTIHKFRVRFGESTTINVPKGSIVVEFKNQGDKLFAWIELGNRVPMVDRLFMIHATGDGVPDDADYVDTCHTDGLVWHLYEYPIA